MSEFIVLGIIATLLAVSLSELIALTLFTQIFELNYRWHPGLWLITPLVTIPLILLTGMLATRKVLRLSPTALLHGS